MCNHWYYDCARKHKGKGVFCTTKAIIEVGNVREEYFVIKTPNLCDLNHVCDEGMIVKWKIHDEMKNLSAYPNTIRKK